LVDKKYARVILEVEKIFGKKNIVRTLELFFWYLEHYGKNHFFFFFLQTFFENGKMDKKKCPKSEI